MSMRTVVLGGAMVIALAGMLATRATEGGARTRMRAGTLPPSKSSAASSAATRTVAIEDRPECPHDWDHVGQRALPAVSVRPGLPGKILNIPEFHDCQQAIVEQSGRLAYGPYLAIFASEELATLEARLTKSGRTPDGSDATAFAAAEIWSNGTYDSLSIKRGQNCLFMWRRGEEWRATMWSPDQPRENACKAAPPTAGVVPGRPLAVFRRTFETHGLTEPDYPAVARWDWDSAHRTQYIGIKCGAAWCEIGIRELEPSPGLPVSSSMSHNEKRVRLVKGWYDSQFLSTLPPNGVSLKPTGIRGYFIPAAELGGRNRFEDFSRFVTTAQVIFQSADPRGSDGEALGKYREHFGIADDAGIGNPNRIDATLALCYGTWKRCGLPRAPGTCTVPGAGDDPPGSDPSSVVATDRRWYSRVTSGGTTRYACITRRNGPIDPATNRPIDIPGTVRWRWKVDDEGGWMRCVFGCCELL